MKMIPIGLLLLLSTVSFAVQGETLSNPAVQAGVVATPTPTTAVGTCNAGKIEIISNFDTVKAGEIVEFEVVSETGLNPELKFVWEVSPGIIVSEQRTRKIAVQTTTEMLTAWTPDPTPNATPKPNGYFSSGSFGRTRGRPLSVIVNISDLPGCSHVPLQRQIFIGTKAISRNLPPVVSELVLNNDRVQTPCAKDLGQDLKANVEPETSVAVSVMASDPENDVLTYIY